GADIMPPGVKNAEVTIAPGGSVRAKAVVDLDEVRNAETRGWLDPLAYVTGSVEIAATGTLTAADGMGTLAIQEATIGGLSVAPVLLQEIISFYTRTPELPKGFDITQPFPLPANIRAVETAR